MRDKRREKERNRARRRRNNALGPYVRIARRNGDVVEYLIGRTKVGLVWFHERRYAQLFTRPQALHVMPVLLRRSPSATIVEVGALLPEDEREALARACEAHLVKA